MLDVSAMEANRMASNDRLLNVDQVAALLGVSASRCTGESTTAPSQRECDWDREPSGGRNPRSTN